MGFWVNNELGRLYEILVAFLGESKQGFSEDCYQYEFPCPRCIEKYGSGEIRKNNLSVSLVKQRMNCWRCSSEGENMHGSIVKLIRMYGNEKLLAEYKEIIHSIRESEMYKLHFAHDEFNIDTSVIEREELKFPSSFKRFEKNGYNSRTALNYLFGRGIDWQIINDYKIGFTEAENDENRKSSYRIIIPSYDALGEVNYWVGRDYLKDSRRKAKYDNPNVEKRDIIFNEEKVQWDADITLVEGPFDHIVVPNSIPLLGKALNEGYRLYWELNARANAKVNIFLDGDAFGTVKEIYKFLNHGRLYNKIRFIPTEEDEDPSSLFQKGGRKEILRHLKCASAIKEFFL